MHPETALTGIGTFFNKERTCPNRKFGAFSQEFRHDAVQRMLAGEGASALAHELGVLRKSSYEWKDKYAEKV